MSKVKFPCNKCLVFPMCKTRAHEAKKTLNSSGLFAYMKGHCSILQKAYDKFNKSQRYNEILQPYHKQRFPRAVLNQFNLFPNRYDDKNIYG